MSAEAFLLGFDVFVRRKGKFVKASQEPLTEKSATGLGQLIASQTSARSFFIAPASGRAKRVSEYENVNLGFQFRRPIGRTKLPFQAFVEKSKFAINRPQEKKEITEKGIAANKRRLQFFGFPKKKKKKGWLF